MFEKFQISSSSCPFYKQPNSNEELETEGLFGETFYLKKSIPYWGFGFLETDGYFGWVQTKNLEKRLDVNFQVTNIRTFIFCKQDVKSKIISYLSLCSLVRVINIDNNWATIKFLKNNKEIIAYVPLNHISEIKNKNTGWNKIANSLSRIPYKWGGRDTFGLDCSSLVQLICNTQDIYLPRNTNNQISYIKQKYPSKIVTNIEDHYDLGSTSVGKGSIIFWRGHVGIFLNKNNVLHANAFHNNVETENIKSILKRFRKNNLPIKLICHLLP